MGKKQKSKSKAVSNKKTPLDKIDSSKSIVGSVLTRARTGLLVKGPDGSTHWCRVPGKGSKSGMPVPGDNVEYIEPTDTSDGWITGIQERKSLLQRFVFGRIKEIASNMDQLILIATPGEPNVSPRLVDRMLVGASIGNLDPVIIINKTDLFNEEEISSYCGGWEKAGYPVFKMSAISGDGLHQLEEVLKGKVSLLLGASGVGKSTLLNQLIEDLDLDTTAVSESSGRGVHTTTFTKLFPLPSGGIVADTPGMREFYPVIEEIDKLRFHFPELAEYAEECTFDDCLHLENSSGCAVREAAEDGLLSMERYESYQLIYASLLEGPKRGRATTQGKKYLKK